MLSPESSAFEGETGANLRVRPQFLTKDSSTLIVPSSRMPLYVQMALKDDEREKDALEQQKKRLEEIRALRKPLEKIDLMEHAINYEKIRYEKEQALKEKRKAVLQADKERTGKLPTFRSTRASQDDILYQLREPGQLLGIEREKEEAVQAKKKAHNKIAKYGKYVRDVYWPKISDKIQSEMVSLRAKADQENTATRQVPKHRMIVDTSAWRNHVVIKSQS